MPVVLKFKNENQSLEIPLLSKITVGRSSSCDLKLEDKQMSGKHGSFEVNSSGQVLYTDLGSTNGSYINNSKITKSVFKLDDDLKIGNTTVTIDEKSLSSKERMAIGRNTASKHDEILAVSSITTKPIVAPPQEVRQETKEDVKAERKSIVLNKELKKKKTQQSNWSGRNDESTFEVEESGMTKILKLDNKIGLGKKKK